MIIRQKIQKTFSKENLWIGLKSLIHGLAAIWILYLVSPHDLEVAVAGGLVYGAVMHFLFHYRADQKE